MVFWQLATGNWKLFFGFSGGFFLAAGGGFLSLAGKGGFALFGSGEAGFEAVDAAFGVDDLFFTGEERVAGAADVYFDEWILVAVFPFDGVISSSRALRQKGKTSGVILKNHRTIVGRV